MNARKLALAGAASVAVAVGTLALPLTHSAGATSAENKKGPQRAIKLRSDNNAAVSLSTELDCSTHTLTAKVTNKTDAAVSPKVTFNGEKAVEVDAPVIEAGQTADYTYRYTGNALKVETAATVDTKQAVTVSPTLYCSEPVTFNVTKTSRSAVVGELKNNNSILPQIAYTQVGSGDVRMEILMPGETRTIAMPFTSVMGQLNANVKIGTVGGYESSYTVGLNVDATTPQPAPAQPAPETEKPAPEESKPAPETEKPAPEAEESAPEAEKPSPEADKPAPEVEKPVSEKENQ